MKQIRETMKVYDYGMPAFMQAVEKAILEGYRLDMTDNEGIPQAYGGFYECTMFKEASNLATEPEKKVEVIDKIEEKVDVKVATVDESATSTQTKVDPDAPSAIATARVGRPKRNATPAQTEGA